MTIRRVIFLSHGNPEDNELAEWLAFRLRAAGYSVWIDLWHGKGHPTWQEIEAVLRNHAVRVVSLVSKLGVEKPGFKDETNAACGVGRDLNDSGFIIPVRLDDISFQTQVPIQLGRLNFIDGNKNGWDKILADLLEQLDIDAIPREPIPTSRLYEDWLKRRKSIESALSDQPERLLSNWYEIESLPQTMNFYSSNSLKEQWERGVALLPFPKRHEEGLLCTFAPANDVRMNLPLGVSLKLVKKIPTEQFLKGSRASPIYQVGEDSRRVIVDLIRQGFGTLAISRGMREQRLTNRTAWFLCQSVLGEKRVGFSHDGVRGARQLTGRHKDVYWHYAVSVDVTLKAPRRLTLVGHVLFSRDGEHLLEDSKLSAKLRRQAVRSKRNAWWRDVMLAYVAYLTSNQPFLALPMGGNSEVRVVNWPIEFKSPLTLEFDDTSETLDDPIDDTLADAESELLSDIDFLEGDEEELDDNIG